jgi:hypothetical protein
MLNDAGGEMKVAHLLMLAQFFEVSFQAVTLRLEELGRINRGTYQMLNQRGFKPRKAEDALGFGVRTPVERLPFRYVFLVARLYGVGLISEGDVAAYLHTDRLTARELLLAVPEAGAQGSDDTIPGLDTRIEVSN